MHGNAPFAEWFSENKKSEQMICSDVVGLQGLEPRTDRL